MERNHRSSRRKSVRRNSSGRMVSNYHISNSCHKSANESMLWGYPSLRISALALRISSRSYISLLKSSPSCEFGSRAFSPLYPRGLNYYTTSNSSCEFGSRAFSPLYPLGLYYHTAGGNESLKLPNTPIHLSMHQSILWVQLESLQSIVSAGIILSYCRWKRIS